MCLNVQHTGTCHSLVGRNRKGTMPCRVRDRITISLKGDIKIRSEQLWEKDAWQKWEKYSREMWEVGLIRGTGEKCRWEGAIVGEDKKRWSSNGSQANTPPPSSLTTSVMTAGKPFVHKITKTCGYKTKAVAKQASKGPGMYSVPEHSGRVAITLLELESSTWVKEHAH